MPETLMVASLFDELHVEIGMTPQERFEHFHALNKHVYVELRQLALEWVESGHDHCAIDMLFNVLRWQSGLRTKGDSYLLNNDFRAPYSRLLMTNEPRLAGVFETRKSRHDQNL